jgi:GalNAc-alpha-(1->4)-GalNAc-alpha-(1->3)-diNAcBac-PP-undecaprenol alpha-1,4-N-acetyl-D-galactosaminyltransferase
VVTFSKQPGGAEKSAIKLAVSLKNDCFDFTEVATLRQSELDFYTVPENLPEVYFFPNYNKLMNSKLFGKMFFSFLLIPFDLYANRRLIRKGSYDVVVSFGAGVGCLMYFMLFGLGIPHITSERISPDSKIYRPSMFTRVMRPWIYRHGVICSVQSAGFQQIVKNLWRVESFITPNHFEIPLRTYGYVTNKNPCIGVGRPSYQKGYDILIDAWKLLENRVSNELWIVADDSNGFIQGMISQKNAKHIKVLPLTNNLFELYDQCSLFISTSRFEGYPNALAEAMIYGIPSLATVSSDVVHDWCELGICLKIDSLEPAKVAAAIEEALNSPMALKVVSQRAIQDRNNFSWENTKKSWENIIAIALNSNSNTN